MKKQPIKIFDTTLRDGQQCPGAAMSFEKNLEYAELAKKLRFDVVEAGFPSAGKVDFDIVRAVAENYGSSQNAPIVAGLCQLRDEQVDITIEALMPAVKNKRARLHTYVPVAPELMIASLGDKADKAAIQKNLYDFTRRSVNAGLEVEFSPEGYSRQGENFNFVTDLIRAAVEGGATVINCPDTIGGSCEYEGENYFVNQMNKHSQIIFIEFPDREILWSVHCHNDFGLATANSIKGVFEGPALQIEGCINGIGERAGNVALEQIVMIIKNFGNLENLGKHFYTNIDYRYLQEVCDFVSRYMLPRQPHWPVCGENAARHSSGGHTNAVMNNPLAYQPFDPREIGKEISFVFGPLSGGNHAQSIITEAGYACEDGEKSQVAQHIKEIFKDRRKGITDREVLEGYFSYRQPISIDSFDYSRSQNRSTITITGKCFDESGVINGEHEGKDSALAALKKVVDKYYKVQIQSHRSQSEGAGIEAKSISTIVVSDDAQNLFEGIGSDQDIEISAMRAFVDAVNKAYIEKMYCIK